MPLSRRAFAHLLGASAAAAAAPAWLAAAAAAKHPAGSVRLNANENPYGPSSMAIDAMRQAFATAARYPDDESDQLATDIAAMHGVSTDDVVLGDGSSEILKLAALGYSGPGRAVVMGDPTFEALAHYARAGGAPVVLVPLTSTYAHDLAKMAPGGAGVVYVCNPNNPTATITPKGALRSFLDSVPPSTIVVVDEAYHHYATSPEYESVIPLIQTRPNLVVARTFSKIYAMAGLRCGYAIASRDVARKLKEQKAWDTMNLMALVAARASLRDHEHVARGRERNAATKSAVVAQLSKLGYTTLPSEANFLMIDVRRDVKPLIAAMRERGVQVGRLFPAMPHYMRVTIGTPDEMTRFVDTFREVMA